MEKEFRDYRPSRDVTFAMVAKVISLRATCLRARVGAVIVKDKRIVSVGYNGALPDEDHCNSELCNEHSPCLNTIHAEANAIYHAAKAGTPIEGATMYCTHSPCRKCSEAIIQAGIARVVFIKEYRDTPWALFRSTKIERIDDEFFTYGTLLQGSFKII
jgi:dCMP deaminase